MKLLDDDLRVTKYAMQKVDLGIPIKKYPNDAYTDEDIRKIVTIMRRQLDEVAKNPALESIYETKSRDWQDEYATMVSLADHRGIQL